MNYDQALEIAKKREPTVVEIMDYAYHAPTVEPTKRKKGEKQSTHQFHRFPLRDGISKFQAIAENIVDHNSFIKYLLSK